MIVSLSYLLFSKDETEEKKYKRTGYVEVAWRKGGRGNCSWYELYERRINLLKNGRKVIS